MKFAILALPLCFFALNAKADVINVKLGQNATLSSGDIAIVGNGKLNTAVSCQGPQEVAEPVPQLPNNQLFEAREFGRFPDGQQETARLIGRDQALGYLCTRDSITPAVRQAQDTAVVHARQACQDAGYPACGQSNLITERFTFRLVGKNPGEFGCEIVARMIGYTN